MLYWGGTENLTGNETALIANNKAANTGFSRSKRPVQGETPGGGGCEDDCARFRKSPNPAVLLKSENSLVAPPNGTLVDIKTQAMPRAGMHISPSSQVRSPSPS